ncbi:hypothetical protein A8B78_12005 [Jannaschia sp. EhC01]|nr:hypothetical protein A8B78_12005 [Jannaschia sp. EhC01]
MAASSDGNRDFKLIGVGAVAVIGWLIALLVWINGNSTTTDLRASLLQSETALEEQQSAVGSLDALRTEISELEPSVETLSAREDELQAEIAQAEERRDVLTGAVEALTEEVATAEAELTRLSEEVAPIREEISTFDQRRLTLQSAIAQSETSLAETDDRLQQSLAREEELRATLIALEEDAATAADTLATTQARLQGLRDEEAPLRDEVQTLTRDRDAARAEVSALEQSIEALTQEQARLTEATAGAESRRADIQQILTQLTAEIEETATRLNAVQAQLVRAEEGLASGNAAGAGDAEANREGESDTAPTGEGEEGPDVTPQAADVEEGLEPVAPVGNAAEQAGEQTPSDSEIAADADAATDGENAAEGPTGEAVVGCPEDTVDCPDEVGGNGTGDAEDEASAEENTEASGEQQPSQ